MKNNKRTFIRTDGVNDFSLEFGYLIDQLTSIMLILITTVGILVLIYSDGYMSHDEGYLRFFV
jgi:NAD(P)H-quinone oxidoreductase subunit 5